MTVKERLHSLVEQLPEGEAETAMKFLEFLRHEARDPVARALLSASFDDEALTPEDLAALEEAERDWKEGRVLPAEEAERRFLRDP